MVLSIVIALWTTSLVLEVSTLLLLQENLTKELDKEGNILIEPLIEIFQKYLRVARETLVWGWGLELEYCLSQAVRKTGIQNCVAVF